MKEDHRHTGAGIQIVQLRAARLIPTAHTWLGGYTPGTV